MYRIGVDLGGTNIAVGIVDERHKILCSAHTPTRAGKADIIVSDMLMCVTNAMNELGAVPEECLGIGIGSPGLCDSAAGVIRNAHNLGLYGSPICDMLTAETGLTAKLANDADCAALGESVAGAAKGSASALMITLGTGIGGGLIIDGRIYSGYKSLGGEFGHFCISMDGEPCSCGQRGCWEAYASASALVRQARAAAERYPASALNSCGEINGRSVYACAAAGDAAAAAVTEKYAEYVGVGLVGFINSLYPQMILLGGGVSGAGEALLRPVRQYVSEHLFAADKSVMPEIRLAALGNEAGIIGAAALV